MRISWLTRTCFSPLLCASSKGALGIHRNLQFVGEYARSSSRQIQTMRNQNPSQRFTSEVIYLHVLKPCTNQIWCRKESVRVWKRDRNQNLFPMRYFSSISKYDLLAGSISHQGTSQRRPKVVLDAYSSSGFDVLNLLHVAPQNASVMSTSLTKPNPMDEDSSPNAVHMKGSIIVFPYSCFLWNISRPDQVTLESLAIVALHKPPIQYLFIGSNKPIHKAELVTIQKNLKQQSNIIVEQMDLVCGIIMIILLTRCNSFLLNMCLFSLL